MNRLKRLIVEIHQRSLWQALVVYLGASFAALEALTLFRDEFGLPDWLLPAALVLLLIGLPVVIVTSLAKEEVYGDVVPEERAAAAAAEDRQLRLLTWRTAGLSFLAALALWGMVAAGLLLFAGYGPVPADERRSIAVLPFDNLSPDPENEFFTDGMHAEIIAQLSKIADLKVINRTSVMEYKGKSRNLRIIAEELGVTNILEGTVRRADGRVRITTQLMDAFTEEHLWTEIYERNLSDVFGVQSHLAQRVAAALRAELTAAERERIEVRPTENLEAYDSYLLGRYHHFVSWGDEAFSKAIGYYEEAIAKDPTFAGAHAALALTSFGWYFAGPEVLQRAAVAARKAEELDSALPEAHAALGMARMVEWDWSGSEAAFKRALELDPNSSLAHQWYAQLLRQTMRLDEALREARLAAELDPLSLLVKTMVGWVLYNQRRYDEAIEVWDKVLELEPEFGLAIYNQGLAYWMKGMGEEVISAARRSAAARMSMSGLSTFLLAIGHALSGQSDRAREVIDELEAQYSTTSPELIAAYHHVLGEDEEALDWLERAYELRAPWLPNVTSEPVFDGLRHHPRFRALRAKMGLP